LFAPQLISTFGYSSRSPEFALKVRAVRSKPPVAVFFLDLAVGIEVEYIYALPTEPLSADQACIRSSLGVTAALGSDLIIEIFLYSDVITRQFKSNPMHY